VEWLLCDYGEVLCLPPPADDRRALQRLAGWPADHDSFWAAYWEDRLAYDRGDVTAAEFWTRLIGHRPDNLTELIAQDRAMWLHPNAESVQAISESRVRLALFSNAPIEVAEGIERSPGLAPFNKYFFSCYLRATKPDVEAYRKVLAALAAEPEDVVFVDDRPPNIDAARALGIEAHLFDGPELLRELVSGSRPRPR
jgi:putative hydrolase of the HAD superfamily